MERGVSRHDTRARTSAARPWQVVGWVELCETQHLAAFRIVGSREELNPTYGLGRRRTANRAPLAPRAMRLPFSSLPSHPLQDCLLVEIW